MSDTDKLLEIKKMLEEEKARYAAQREDFDDFEKLQYLSLMLDKIERIINLPYMLGLNGEEVEILYTALDYWWDRQLHHQWADVRKLFATLESMREHIAKQEEGLDKSLPHPLGE